MDLAEGLGYLALVLVVASSSMKTMTPLRLLSIASNLTLIIYSLAQGLLPLQLKQANAYSKLMKMFGQGYISRK